MNRKRDGESCKAYAREISREINIETKKATKIAHLVRNYYVIK